MNVIDRSCYLVVVDTDQYAGSFEREMVAFMTGHVGECGVGQKHADLAQKESEALGFDPRMETYFGFPEVVYFSDGNCRRPATIWETNTWVADGCGGYKKSPSGKGRCLNSVAVGFSGPFNEEELKLLSARARRFCAEYRALAEQVNSYLFAGEGPTFKGLSLIRFEVVTTQTVRYVEAP